MTKMKVENVLRGGSTTSVEAAWWAKAVQVDLEARGVVARTDSRPLRLYRCLSSRAR